MEWTARIRGPVHMQVNAGFWWILIIRFGFTDVRNVYYIHAKIITLIKKKPFISIFGEPMITTEESLRKQIEEIRQKAKSKRIE